METLWSSGFDWNCSGHSSCQRILRVRAPEQSRRDSTICTDGKPIWLRGNIPLRVILDRGSVREAVEHCYGAIGIRIHPRPADVGRDFHLDAYGYTKVGPFTALETTGIEIELTNRRSHRLRYLFCTVVPARKSHSTKSSQTRRLPAEISWSASQAICAVARVRLCGRVLKVWPESVGRYLRFRSAMNFCRIASGLNLRSRIA
jgi:hypothetical protein